MKRRKEMRDEYRARREKKRSINTAKGKRKTERDRAGKNDVDQNIGKCIRPTQHNLASVAAELLVHPENTTIIVAWMTF